MRDKPSKSTHGDQGRANKFVEYIYKGGIETVELPNEQLRKYITEIRNHLKKNLNGLVPQKRVNDIFNGEVLFVRISRERDVQIEKFFDTRQNAERRDIVNKGKSYYEENLKQWRRSSRSLEKALSGSPDTNLSLSTEVMDQIRATLHPESKITNFAETRRQPRLGRSYGDAGTTSIADRRYPKPSSEATRKIVLDLEQEQIARNLVGRGHRILFGVAGSGKTVILIARARYQAERHPDQRTLVLCFNKALSLYLRQALGTSPNIDVKTFYQWAGAEFRNQAFGHEQNETYETALIEHLDQSGVKQKYGCILIDESQDWRVNWFRAVLRAAEDPDNGDLLVTGDGSQTIYARSKGFSWKSCGINARGRVINRRGGRINTFRNYRNVPEIVALATHFAKSYVAHDESSDMMSLLPNPKECGKAPSGHLPIICRFSATKEETEAVSQTVKSLAQLGGYQTKDIAVLCPELKDWQIRWVDPMAESLRRHGIASTWINTSDANHSAVLDNSISIVSAKLVKGLEFKACFVIGADHFNPRNPELLYVAMTRATDRLCVSGSWTNQTPAFIRQLTSEADLFNEGTASGAWTRGLMPTESMMPLNLSSFADSERKPADGIFDDIQF